MNDPVTWGGEEREEAHQILSQQDIASRIDGFLANAPHSLDFDFEKRLSAVNGKPQDLVLKSYRICAADRK